MNVDYFRYLALASNFLNLRLCEIQLGAQCLLGEHGPLKLNFKLNHCFAWAPISMLTSLAVVNVHAGSRLTPFHSAKKVREIKQMNDCSNKV